jgi:hypothetical protein
MVEAEVVATVVEIKQDSRSHRAIPQRGKAKYFF